MKCHARSGKVRTRVHNAASAKQMIERTIAQRYLVSATFLALPYLVQDIVGQLAIAHATLKVSSHSVEHRGVVQEDRPASHAAHADRVPVAIRGATDLSIHPVGSGGRWCTEVTVPQC